MSIMKRMNNIKVYSQKAIILRNKRDELLIRLAMWMNMSNSNEQNNSYTTEYISYDFLLLKF